MGTGKKRILVTDDEPNIVDIITSMLERNGYETIKTYSGQECLNKTRAERPDLIFLDIMMERMDGWETARLVKSDPAIREIPIIMVTAKPLTFEDVQDRAMLIENYIMKPVSAGELNGAIDEVFKDRSRIERTLEMARKSGVQDEIIDKYKDKYARLYRQYSRNVKLLMLLEKMYSGDRIAGDPTRRNMMASMRKGLKLLEAELKRLEEILGGRDQNEPNSSR